MGRRLARGERAAARPLTPPRSASGLRPACVRSAPSLKPRPASTDTPVVLAPTADLAAWVVPSVLGVLALMLSAVLVTMVHRRRLAAIPALEDVEPPVPPREGDVEVRVLQRQVDVLTRTLTEWDEERRRLEQSAPTALTTHPLLPAPPTRSAVAPALSGPLATPAAGSHEPPAVDLPPDEPTRGSPGAAADAPVGPSTAYVALSRELARAGDAAGAVLAQWVADLQVLRPAIGDHGPELARAVAAVRHDDPVAALRTCREEALGLVRAAGPVRALLAPLDHLVDAPTSGRSDQALALPPALLALLPREQAERLRTAVRAPGMTA